MEVSLLLRVDLVAKLLPVREVPHELYPLSVVQLPHALLATDPSVEPQGGPAVGGRLMTVTPSFEDALNLDDNPAIQGRSPPLP